MVAPVKRFFLLLLCLQLACVSDGSFSDDPLVEARPYLSAIPNDYDGSPHPLIVTIHGFGENGLDYGNRSGLQSLVTERGFILVAPDGEELVPDSQGWSFSCCRSDLNVSDDIAYLRAVIADISGKYNIDADRVYVVGFSNGAFMAQQMACRASDLVAAMAAHAGTFISGEESGCNPESSVAVMYVHGTADQNVLLGGGTLDYGLGSFDYISASDLITHWRVLNACDASSANEQIDGDGDQTGQETTIRRYQNCTSKAVEYWEMNGSAHLAEYTATYLEKMIDFLFAHTKRSSPY